jgi:hypothetical protein
MPDNFSDHLQSLNSPGYDAAAVTPADGTDLNPYARALYIGVTGDVTVDMASGLETTILFKAVPVGMLWIRVKRVRATGTTATNIVALW